MDCKEIKKKNITEKYLLDKLSYIKEEEFEEHCLKCDKCFKSLKKEGEIISFLKETEKESLFPDSSKSVRRLSPYYRRLSYIGAVIFILIFSLIFFLLVKKRPMPDKYIRLAEVRTPIYISAQIRICEKNKEFQNYFEEGMSYYQKKEYKLASEKLMKSIKLSPQNPQANFFLGISYLFGGKTNVCIKYLKKVISLKSEAYIEESHWYLGKAYLRKGEIKEALKQFEIVVNLKKKYQAEAEKIVRLLK